MEYAKFFETLIKIRIEYGIDLDVIAQITESSNEIKIFISSEKLDEPYEKGFFRVGMLYPLEHKIWKFYICSLTDLLMQRDSQKWNIIERKYKLKYGKEKSEAIIKAVDEAITNKVIKLYSNYCEEGLSEIIMEMNHVVYLLGKVEK